MPDPTPRETPPKLEKPASDSGLSSSVSDAIKKLTPEEQMALFEQELKENDWGHQPC